MLRLYSYLAAALLGTAILPGSADTPAALQLEDPWVRALPPGQPNTAAYVSLYNPGEQAVRVTGAASPVAGRVEIHRTRAVEGFTRMEQLSEVVVAPGARVALQPGGTHLMLLELARMPREGETVRICLRTAQSVTVCTEAPVRRSREAMREHSHH